MIKAKNLWNREFDVCKKKVRIVTKEREGAKVVAVIEDDLLHCYMLFSDLDMQCFGPNHIMREDPVLAFHFRALQNRLAELVPDCSYFRVCCLKDA